MAASKTRKKARSSLRDNLCFAIQVTNDVDTVRSLPLFAQIFDVLRIRRNEFLHAVLFGALSFFVVVAAEGVVPNGFAFRRQVSMLT